MADNVPGSEWLKRGKSLDTSSEEDTPCRGEGFWYEKCKKCHCESGVASCTEVSCEGGLSDLYWTCEGNVSFKIDCNWCHCDDQHRGYYCTEIYCPTSEGLHNIFSKVSINISIQHQQTCQIMYFT